MRPIFITGIGTGIGKTVVSAIITQALRTDYWKPVQAGFTEGTDSEWVKKVIANNQTIIHPEIYKLQLPASPHIAAFQENRRIRISEILNQYLEICNTSKGSNRALVIEGAGGLMVPLNESEFVIDLIKSLQAKVVLVSRNYLGSINHSLLTAALCRQYRLDVGGWIFNDQYLNYEDEIVRWSGYKKIASIPFSDHADAGFIQQQAERWRNKLYSLL